MNLHRVLRDRADEHRPMCIGVIGDGEMLDGEAGCTNWAKRMPARDSVELGSLPIDLASNVTLEQPVAAGQCVRWSDVQVNVSSQAVQVRREPEVTLPESRNP